MRPIAISVVLALPLAACDKKPAPETTASSTPSALSAPTSAAPASMALVRDEDLATEEEFEEEAEREISLKDIEAELDRLEKEIQ